jgi:hypothetical protein
MTSYRSKLMMPVIRISEGTWRRLQAHAKPFEDKPEDIVNLALDALDEKVGQKSSPASEQPGLKPYMREKRGSKVPQKELRQPLLDTLNDLGGSAHVHEIRSALEKKIEHRLGNGDYEKVSTGEARWWNAACWERANMVRDGLIAESSERGIWELTDKAKSLPK